MKPETETDAETVTGEQVNILLVDDRPENLLALSATLASPEYNLLLATSGVEALRALLKHDVALVLLDVLMPGMNGFEIAALIKERNPRSHTPIIFLTAAGTDMKFIYRGYSAGAVDYLVKPVDPDVVRAKVAVFVELFRSRERIRQQAEQLRERERHERVLERAQFTGTLDAVVDAVWIFDPETLQFVYANQGTVAQLGHSLEWLLARSPLDVLPEFDEARLRELCAPLLDGTRAAITLETLARTKDGSERPVEIALQYLHLADGTNRLVSVARDITERKRVEAENVSLYREARTAVAVRDEFLSIASHELKTPLTALQLQVKSLTRRIARGTIAKSGLADGPDELSPRLEAITRHVERLTRLINNLLDISRISAGRLDLEIEELELNALVREVVDRAHEEIERAGCAVSIACGDALTGHWDGFRLEQVITNLLSNAVKYGPGKPIDVTIEPDAAEQVRVVVRDRGIGIRAEDQARIFQRFERAVSERHYGGFGLGLWIVRQIVDALGGTIAVTSVPDEGSTFTVTLPRHAVAKRSVPSSPPPALDAAVTAVGTTPSETDLATHAPCDA